MHTVWACLSVSVCLSVRACTRYVHVSVAIQVPVCRVLGCIQVEVVSVTVQVSACLISGACTSYGICVCYGTSISLSEFRGTSWFLCTPSASHLLSIVPCHRLSSAVHTFHEHHRFPVWASGGCSCASTVPSSRVSV
jgi:hypothetical protein